MHGTLQNGIRKWSILSLSLSIKYKHEWGTTAEPLPIDTWLKTVILWQLNHCVPFEYNWTENNDSGWDQILAGLERVWYESSLELFMMVHFQRLWRLELTHKFQICHFPQIPTTCHLLMCACWCSQAWCCKGILALKLFDIVSTHFSHIVEQQPWSNIDIVVGVLVVHEHGWMLPTQLILFLELLGGNGWRKPWSRT